LAIAEFSSFHMMAEAIELRFQLSYGIDASKILSRFFVLMFYAAASPLSGFHADIVAALLSAFISQLRQLMLLKSHTLPFSLDAMRVSLSPDAPLNIFTQASRRHDSQ